MWSSTSVSEFFLLLIFLLVNDSICVKNVTLIIQPESVEIGKSVILSCFYDLEEEKLYAVKWYYRGLYEFYRYVPKDSSPIKQFPRHGLTIDIAASNTTQVVLQEIDYLIAGKFSCEVTTESTQDSTIHTSTNFKSLAVVKFPESSPKISVKRGLLDYGDILRANCTSFPSRPPADLSFILNNIIVNQTEPKVLRTNQNDWSDLQLEIKLSSIHFTEGRLLLKCVAKISTIYEDVAELELESARHPEPQRVSSQPSSAPTTPDVQFTSLLLLLHIVLLAFVPLQTCYLNI